MAPKLLAGESMVLPTVRKHWIVMARTLVWPVIVGVLLLVADFILPTVSSTRRYITSNIEPTSLELLIAIVLLVLILGSIIGLEVPRSRAAGGPGPGLGLWLAILIGLLVVTIVLRFALGDVEILLTLLMALVIIGLAAWWAWLYWQSGTMTITDQRVILEHGVLRRAAKIIPLDRVQDVSTTQSVLGRLMDYGSVEIDTAGAIPNELFDYARHPDMLRDQVFVLSEQLRRGI